MPAKEASFYFPSLWVHPFQKGELQDPDLAPPAALPKASGLFLLS